MSALGFESIDHTVQLTHAWINDLDQILGWDNKPRAYRLLRVALQALRDWLQVEDCAHFGAQLPTLLRGIYYEHWRPAATPVKQRDRASFLARIDQAFEMDPIDDTAGAARAVFRVLSSKITTGETDKVRHALPHDVRDLWPAPS
ncbi:MAG: DUF2267 domain-containing protein [Roseiarcus sp.]